jgi:hypothetical protein
MIDLTGTDYQKAQFLKRIKQPVERIAKDVLAVMGLVDMPVVFRIVLRGNSEDVRKMHMDFYGKPLAGVAFTGKSRQSIYLPIDTTARIVAHEMSHHVLNAYFTDPIPTALHELITQTVEELVCKKYSRWFW